MQTKTHSHWFWFEIKNFSFHHSSYFSNTIEVLCQFMGFKKINVLSNPFSKTVHNFGTHRKVNFFHSNKKYILTLDFPNGEVKTYKGDLILFFNPVFTKYSTYSITCVFLSIYFVQVIDIFIYVFCYRNENFISRFYI